MNLYKKKLIVIAKNNAKERIHNAALKVNELCQTLKSKSVRGTLSPYSICYR